MTAYDLAAALFIIGFALFVFVVMPNTEDKQ